MSKFDPPCIERVPRHARGLYIDGWRGFGYSQLTWFETQETLAARHGVTERTIRNWEGALERAGVIWRERKGKGPTTSRIMHFTAHSQPGSRLPGSVPKDPETDIRVRESEPGNQGAPTRKADVANKEGDFRRVTEKRETAAEGSTEPSLAAADSSVNRSSGDTTRAEDAASVARRLAMDILEPAGVCLRSCPDIVPGLEQCLRRGWFEEELAQKLRHVRHSLEGRNAKNGPGLLVHLVRQGVLEASPPPFQETQQGRRAMEAEEKRRRKEEDERGVREWADDRLTYRTTGTSPLLQLLRERGAHERANALEEQYRAEIAELWPEDSQ